ncbi:MAG: DUF881 domain-containing protein [Nocardioides sp.]
MSDLPEHVTTPLLTLITRRSLDADYQHVAARRAAAGEETRRSSARPHRTAAGVLIVFGVLVATAAVQTSRNSSITDASRASLIGQVNDQRGALDGLQRHLASVSAENRSLDRKLTGITSDEQQAEQRLQRLQLPSGFSPVHGPGVSAIVDSATGGDATQQVRDSDLALLVDGFWGAGAEAISVNGHRLTVLSAFRNVGVAILVDNQPMTPPYTLSVIGDPQSLQANLLANSAGQGWYALKNGLGFRFEMHNVDDLSLPGATLRPLRHVTPLDISAQDRATPSRPGGEAP